MEKFFFQISSNNDESRKCKETIEKFKKSPEYQQAEQFFIIFYREVKNKSKNSNSKVIIYDLKDLLRIVQDVSDSDKIDRLYDYCCRYEGIPNLPELVKQKKSLCDWYVERSVARCEQASERLSLKEIFQATHRIVLLGDAAMGKSQELRNLYNHLMDSGNPYFYELKNYTGQEIENILPTNFVLYEKTTILLDAFDEMNPTYVNEFVPKLNTFATKYAAIDIIISSRSNFYERNSEFQTFSNFTAVFLNELNQDEMVSYIEKREGNVQAVLTLSNFEQSLSNTFYLSKLVDLSLKGIKVSSKVELMKDLFQISFERCVGKNKRIKKDVFHKLLMHFAFKLVATGKTVVDTISDETLLKFDWIKKDDRGVAFEHNNYKEYLAAEYLMQLEIGTIKDEICLCINGEDYIKPQYYNVLGFLLEMKNSDTEFIEFIKRNGKEILMHSEMKFFRDSEKCALVVSIIDEYDRKRSWLDSARFSLEDLTRCSNNLTTINKLCEFLDLQYDRTTIISVIKILSKTTHLQLIKSKIYDTVFGWLENELVLKDSYFTTTIMGFVDLLANDVEVSKLLIKRFFSDERSAVRAQANYILYKHKLANYFIENMLSCKKKSRLKAHFSDEEDMDIIDA